MPDITKCNLSECPKALTCYRYVSKASDYQSWFYVEDTEEFIRTCENYWNIKDR